MAEKVSAAPERPRGAGHVGSSCSSSSSGSETLSEEGELGACGAAATGRLRRLPGEERASTGGQAEEDASLDERDEELGHILSPAPLPSQKPHSPEAFPSPGKTTQFKRQLSEDVRQLRRESLGALSGKYLLPSATVQQLWQPAKTSNLIRMRYQALGQSAPSLTFTLKTWKIGGLAVLVGLVILYVFCCNKTTQYLMQRQHHLR